MFPFELELYESGYEYIAGIDEVGRGCLFGDVVAAAVVMPKASAIEGVRDSKKLSEKKREKLDVQIREEAIAIGIGRVSAAEIDQINIRQATHKAMRMAVEDLKDSKGQRIVPDYLLIDAEKPEISIPYGSLIKGDEKSYLISCASIVAKVFRDGLCILWDERFPGYGIAKHKGYGTSFHRDILKKAGATSEHRKTFLKKIL